uniref:Uncharacterized protein n=3 Tax=Bactrocera latifrons TaxID=174628 RepID=A0A0K8W6V2_BACLA
MLDSYSRSSVGLSGGSSGILNNNSNALCDDSSGSEDASEGTAHAPVQFLLGGAPTPSLKSATSTAAAATGVVSRTGAAVNHSSLDVNVSNHIGSLGNSTNAIGTSGVASVNAQNATPPPLPPHNNAYNSSYFLNDSQLLRSQSTDLVPMEIYTFLNRQQQQHSTKPNIINGSNSNNHNSLSTGQQFIGSGSGIVGKLSGTNKKMVKQHSTTSQQSTSSTSSSVHSTPSAPGALGADSRSGSGKGQSPGRWSSHERILPIHQQQQQQQHEPQMLIWQSMQSVQHKQPTAAHGQQQQQQPQSAQHAGDKESFMQPQYTAIAGKPPAVGAIPAQYQQLPTSLSLQSLCGGQTPQHGSDNISLGTAVGATTTTTTSAPAAASAHSDTQMEDQLLLSADSASLDGGATIKKRKRRLRFPFGGGHRKSASNASASSGSTASVSVSSNKHT